MRALNKTGKKAEDEESSLSLDFLTENKDEIIGTNIKQTALNLVSMLQFTKLDITQNDPKMIENLISKLKLIVSETKDATVSRACRMLIKSLLGVQIDIRGIPREEAILGHELNYYTSKDFTMMKNIYQRLHGPSPLSIDDLTDIIRYINKVQAKRPAQILKIFAEYPGILNSIVEQLIPHFKEGDQGSESSLKINSFITNEFSSLVDLIVLYYRYAKNTSLARLYPDVEKFSVDDPKLEQVPDDKTSMEVLKLLFDIVINAEKSLKMKLLKSLVKTFHVEFYSYLRDKESKEPLEIQYYGEIYPPKPEEEKMQAIKQAAVEMDLENVGDLEDEQLMEMAISMSLQEKDQICPENQTPSQLQEESKTQTKGPKNYYFYPFDIAVDLMKFLMEKIKAVNTNVENAGILYNCIYKILKMQQIIANKYSKPLDSKWIDIVTNLIHDQVFLFYFK